MTNRRRVRASGEYVFGPPRICFQGFFPARDLGRGLYNVAGGRRIAFIPPCVSKISNNECVFFAAMNAQTLQMVKRVQLGARWWALERGEGL